MGEDAGRSRPPGAPPDYERALARVTVQSVDDVHQAAVALREIARERGLRVCTWDDISSKDPMVDAQGRVLNAEVFHWQEEGKRWWQDHRLALRSPLARACRYESEPFWVSRHGFNTVWRNPYLDEIDMSDYQNLARCNAAVVVPVHLPFGQISANSFVPVQSEKEDLSEEFALHGSFLGALMRRFISGYVQAHRALRRMPSNCILSKREVECLLWAAIGKTDREIGTILGLSHATIRFHVQRAGERLNSVNRAQTVFKAGAAGVSQRRRIGRQRRRSVRPPSSPHRRRIRRRSRSSTRLTPDRR